MLGENLMEGAWFWKAPIVQLVVTWIDQTSANIQRPSANSACLCNSGFIAGTVS